MHFRKYSSRKFHISNYGREEIRSKYCKSGYIRDVLILRYFFRESTASRIYNYLYIHENFHLLHKDTFENPSSRIHKTAKYIKEFSRNKDHANMKRFTVIWHFRTGARYLFCFSLIKKENCGKLFVRFLFRLKLISLSFKTSFAI